MATLATVAEVLEQVETDLPDAVIQRYLDAAEADLRDYVSSDELKTFPVSIWSGRFMPTLGEADNDLRLLASPRGYPITRITGTVGDAGFHADTEELQTDESGLDLIVPVTTAGVRTPTGTFSVEISENGEVLTFDATHATAALTITNVDGLQQAVHPPKMVQAVMDLVQLALRQRGVKSERVGQYDVTLADYHEERNKVLSRLVYASDKSLVS